MSAYEPKLPVSPLPSQVFAAQGLTQHIVDGQPYLAPVWEWLNGRTYVKPGPARATATREGNRKYRPLLETRVMVGQLSWQDLDDPAIDREDGWKEELLEAAKAGFRLASNGKWAEPTDAEFEKALQGAGML